MQGPGFSPALLVDPKNLQSMPELLVRNLRDLEEVYCFP
jgi:hypothetical protein